MGTCQGSLCSYCFRRVRGGGAVLAQTVTQDWASPHRDTGPVNAPDTNKMLAIANDGSAFVVGQKVASLGTSRIAVWKYNPNGTLATGWPKTWPDDPDGKSYGVAAVLDGSGTGVFVVGAYAVDGQGQDIVVLHYDASGSPVLGFTPYTYDNDDTSTHPAQHGDDYPVAASYINNGLWLTGVSVGYGTSTDYVTIGIDSTTGALLAPPKRYDHSSHKADTPVDLKTTTLTSSTGSLVRIAVTGTSFSDTTKDDIQTIEYKLEAGALVETWSHRYTGPDAAMTTKQKATSLVYGLTGGSDGRPIYISGNVYNDVKPDFLVVGYTRPTAGAVDRWVREYNGPGNSDDVTVKIATTASPPYVYVAGSSVGTSGTFDATVMAYQIADGATPFGWSSAYRSPYTVDDRVSDMIVIDDGGSIYVTGQWYNGSNYDYLITKISLTTGTSQWLSPAIYNNLGTDYPAALGFYPNYEYEQYNAYGYIYVSGRNTSVSDSTFKYATVRFVQTP